MDRLARILDERAGDLTFALTMVGFTHDEAKRFVVEAGPELMQSYRWNAATLDGEVASDEAATEVLGSIRARAIATRIGLSTEKIWAGLREFVPAVLEASQVTTAAPQRGPSAVRPRARFYRRAGAASFGGRFGLSFDRISCAP